MLRLNFYKLNTKKEFKDFVRNILISSSDIETGYIQALENKENSLHAIFYLKILVEEKISDPFGGLEKITYFSYQKIEFFLYEINGKVLLIVKDQPKSLKSFINFLKKNDSLFFSVNNCNIDMQKLFFKNEFKVIKAKFINVELSINSFANIEINSRDNALIDYNILKLNGGKKLVKVKILESFDDISFECEFNDKATFSIKIDFINHNLIKYLFDSYILL